MRDNRIGGDGDGSARALSRRLGVVAALALATVFAGLGGSASAAVTGLERITATSPVNSANKSATAACPAGKQVVGAGGDITGGFGEVTLGFVRPNSALTSVTAQAREDENGLALNWSVTAYAVCATPPPGLGLVTATSPNNSANKSVTATCPAGKRVLGTGAEIDGGGGQAAPNDAIPGSSLKSVIVQGLEDQNGTTVNWRVRAYAICANPVAGLERAVATSPTDSATTKAATATCPGGKQVLGGGGELGGGGGEVVLDDLTPAPGLTGVTVRGEEDEDGTSANWFARAFAICAAASERIVAASGNDSLDKSVAASCRAPMAETGGGGDITGGRGQVALTGLTPSIDSSGFSAAAAEDGNGFGLNWVVRSYAICATPLPGAEIVVATTHSDPTESATVFCPAGKRVVGTGGNISSDLRLRGIFPNATLQTVTASATPISIGADPTVTAVAICATPPPGLELVTNTSDPDSDPVSVTATCPSGKNLLGTGAFIFEATSFSSVNVVLDDLSPNAALTHVLATAIEGETGASENWVVRAHAICANP